MSKEKPQKEKKPKIKHRRRGYVGKQNTDPLTKISRLRLTPPRLRKIMETGLTEKKLADILGYHPETIKHWKLNQDFARLMKESKEVADEMVESSAFHNAVGYFSTEETYERVYQKDPKTKEIIESFKLVKKVKKHIAGSEKAQQFWLMNRQPEKWKKEHKQASNVTNNHTIVMMPGFNRDHLPSSADITKKVPIKLLKEIKPNGTNDNKA